MVRALAGAERAFDAAKQHGSANLGFEVFATACPGAERGLQQGSADLPAPALRFGNGPGICRSAVLSWEKPQTSAKRGLSYPLPAGVGPADGS